ncbi:MAG: HlyD family type I secretion periplasmic adaptor subunit [Pseudomonadota bacterium]
MKNPDEQFPKCSRLAREARSVFTYCTLGGMGVFLLWAGFTTLDRVTRGPGRVIPQTQNQTVQHLEGGIVREILVREGDTVKKGDILLNVENSFSQAELRQTRLDIKAKKIKLERLKAEQAGEAALKISEDLKKDMPQVTERELAIFMNRSDNRKAQLSIIDEQIKQKEIELSELKSRWQNTRREQDLLAEQVESLKKLATAGAVSRNQYLEARQAMAQMESKLSDLLHGIPQAEAAITESQRRRSELLSRTSTDIENEMNETEMMLAKLEEAVGALNDRSERSAVLAPIAGVINKLHVSTIGGVVKSGEPLVEIVPTDSSIAVEARLSPSDRAEVWPGQQAIVKISAYDFSIYGGLKGRVVEISPDALQDEKGLPYFRVRLEADRTALGAANPVVPGMMADVDILTGKHSILRYLLKPVNRVAENALRE